MANGNRWSMSHGRRFTAFALMAVGLFILCFGVGLGNAGVLTLGLAVGVLGPAVLLLTAVRATTREYIFGTAHVYSASQPPSAGMVGRAELHLAVFAEGMDGVAVRVLDPAVPVSKWPDDGATLPIEVVANNPRKVRVLWDQVVTHAQAAGEDLYPQFVENLPEDLDDDYDDLPPDDFLDDTDLPPVPPVPPPSMPSGPAATIDAAGMDFAPVSAPTIVPPAAKPPRAAPAPVVTAPADTGPESAGSRPVSPAPVAVAHQDAGRTDTRTAGPESTATDDPDGGPAVSLPLPRRRPSPHLRRPGPRQRRPDDENDDPTADSEPTASNGTRLGGINPVYLEEAPPEPPPEWPLTTAEAAAPMRPESRPEPDDTEVVSGPVVDGYAYSDRSETDRMTFDRASFHTSDLGPMNPGLIDPEPDEYLPRLVPLQPDPEPGPEPEPVAEPARRDPFNVIPLRVRRPRKPKAQPEPQQAPQQESEPAPEPEPESAAAAPDPVDDERDTDAPAAEATEGFGTEPASYLTAPSAGLSQLGAGGFSVTLFVRELSRSVTFYRDVLGLAEVDTGRNSAVLARGESRILLKRVGDLQPVDRRIVHLNLEVPDVQAAYEELKTKGVEFVHKPRVVSQGEQLELWAATFRDPDGHAIALTRWELRR